MKLAFKKSFTVVLTSLALTFSALGITPAYAQADAVPPTVDSFSATSPSSSLDIAITAFTASDDVAVTGYMISESSTAPLAGDSGWSDAAPTTYTVGTDGNYILYPWAKDAADNISAEFGAPVSVTVDTIAPETSIDSQPADPDNDSTPAFTFSGDDGTGSGVASFECQVDSGGYSACTSGTDFGPLSDGSYTFYVRAIDNAGNPDASPDSYTWVVDATAPTTSIDTKPSDPSSSSAAVFTFSGDDGTGSGVASFECQVDSGGYSACTSGTDFGPLSDGSHTYYVRAIDNAGNSDASPDSYTWTIDATAPTVISSVRANASPTSAASVGFTVTFSESVTGVDVADFSLTTSGVTGASITGVSGSGAAYTVTVSTGTGSGTIRLNVPNTATITDLAGNALASLPFTSGEAYTVYRIWYVTTTGLDSNSCASVAAPCLTINGAIGKAVAGDTIEVAIGTYTAVTGTEVVLIDKSITLSGGWNAGFTAQSGSSTIDGQATRRGVTVPASITTYMENFIIQNGHLADGKNGINNNGNLALEKVTIQHNGISSGSGNISGIYNSATGILALSNSAIINNGNAASCFGGIFNQGNFTATNSTISGNISNKIYCYGAALVGYGTVSLNNVTIVNNSGDADMMGAFGTFTLKNSLIGSCGNSTSITSQGYNVISMNQCPLTATTGDQFGTPSTPINLFIGLLQNYGGPTFTHALLGGSPAINAGNPATPGSGGNACLATDQRGMARSANSPCDIGAYERDFPVVASIKRSNPSPTTATSVDFAVTFTKSVTGVDTSTPFNDFALTTIGVTGASITGVSGSGASYTVTVNTGSASGNGTIRLDVVDNDSIQDVSNKPLGGTGAGNGNYTSGEVYTLLNIPTPVSPTGTITDTTPKYIWSKIPAATNYQYQLLKGTTIIYSKTVAAGACGASTCSNNPTTILSTGSYKWKVRAMIGGVWKSYSLLKAFKISDVKAGFWSGPGLELYVTPTTRVDNFAIYIYVNGCGSYKITHTPLVSIVAKHFSFGGSFYASGSFTSLTSAAGSLGLYYFYISGCGYVSGGPFSWTAKWRNTSQPSAMDIAGENSSITILPEQGATFNSFTIDPASP